MILMMMRILLTIIALWVIVCGGDEVEVQKVVDEKIVLMNDDDNNSNNDEIQQLSEWMSENQPRHEMINVAVDAAAAAVAAGGTAAATTTTAAAAAGGGLSATAATTMRASVDRTNFASADGGAKIVGNAPDMKAAPTILMPDMDKYLMVPCGAERKWFTVQLSDDIIPTSVVISNLEHYSSGPKQFQVLGSDTYPTDKWLLLGTLEAAADNRRQAFRLRDTHDWTRFLKIRILTHHKTEYWCTLTNFEVYGRTMIPQMIVDGSGGGTVMTATATTSANDAHSSSVVDANDSSVHNSNNSFDWGVVSKPVSKRRRRRRRRRGGARSKRRTQQRLLPSERRSKRRTRVERPYTSTVVVANATKQSNTIQPKKKIQKPSVAATTTTTVKSPPSSPPPHPPQVAPIEQQQEQQQQKPKPPNREAGLLAMLINRLNRLSVNQSMTSEYTDHLGRRTNKRFDALHVWQTKQEADMRSVREELRLIRHELQTISKRVYNGLVCGVALLAIVFSIILMRKS